MQQTDCHPAYVRLAESGELAHRAKALYSFFRSCQLCPRRRRINRLKGETGVCGATSRVKVASAHPHFKEETPLVGRHGSGTIFFSHCNLLCAYCQNWQISHGGDGGLLSDEGSRRDGGTTYRLAPAPDGDLPERDFLGPSLPSLVRSGLERSLKGRRFA
jgi:hypothetical protein